MKEAKLGCIHALVFVKIFIPSSRLSSIVGITLFSGLLLGSLQERSFVKYSSPFTPLPLSERSIRIYAMSLSAVAYPDEETSLLRKRHVWLKKPDYPSINLQHWYSYPFRGEGWSMQSSKEKTARFLSSKFGHYSVLGLVSLDVLGIIAGEGAFKVQVEEAQAHALQTSSSVCSNANEANTVRIGMRL